MYTQILVVHMIRKHDSEVYLPLHCVDND